LGPGAREVGSSLVSSFTRFGLNVTEAVSNYARGRSNSGGSGERELGSQIVSGEFGETEGSTARLGPGLGDANINGFLQVGEAGRQRTPQLLRRTTSPALFTDPPRPSPVSSMRPPSPSLINSSATFPPSATPAPLSTPSSSSTQQRQPSPAPKTTEKPVEIEVRSQTPPIADLPHPLWVE